MYRYDHNYIVMIYIYMLVHTLYIYIYILDTNILYTHVRLIPTLPTAQNNVSAKFAGIASAYQVDNFFSATQIN